MSDYKPEMRESGEPRPASPGPTPRPSPPPPGPWRWPAARTASESTAPIPRKAAHQRTSFHWHWLHSQIHLINTRITCGGVPERPDTNSKKNTWNTGRFRLTQSGGSRLGLWMWRDTSSEFWLHRLHFIQGTFCCYWTTFLLACGKFHAQSSVRLIGTMHALYLRHSRYGFLRSCHVN